MTFNFDWNYIASGAPYMTISEYALSFNAPAVSLLGNPEEVVLGFDDKQMVIGVRQYHNEPGIKSFKFYSRMKNGWIRIGCKDFVKYLSQQTGIDFSPAKRYLVQFDADEKLIFVPVQEVPDDEIDEEVAKSL